MKKIYCEKRISLDFCLKSNISIAYIVPFRWYIRNADMNELYESPAKGEHDAQMVNQT